VIVLLASAGLLLANRIQQNMSSKASAPPSALRENLFVKVDPRICFSTGAGSGRGGQGLPSDSGAGNATEQTKQIGKLPQGPSCISRHGSPPRR
jgi:hypothetical protein